MESFSLTDTIHVFSCDIFRVCLFTKMHVLFFGRRYPVWIHVYNLQNMKYIKMKVFLKQYKYLPKCVKNLLNEYWKKNDWCCKNDFLTLWENSRPPATSQIWVLMLSRSRPPCTIIGNATVDLYTIYLCLIMDGYQSVSISKHFGHFLRTRRNASHLFESIHYHTNIVPFRYQ